MRSLSEAAFAVYLDTSTELVIRFFAPAHTNYACLIPVHLKDMAELAKKHPDIYSEFSAGHFTVQKTKRVFSSIPIDQAHEQNNAYMCMSRAMGGQLASQTTQVPFGNGWLQDHRLLE